MNDFAFLETIPGEFVCAVGPFSATETPPEEGTAFYINDFRLSDPAPWKVPTKAFLTSDPTVVLPDNGGTEMPEIVWDNVPAEPFRATYSDVQSDIAAGRIEKSVPVITEKGHLHQGNPAAVIRMMRTLREAFWSYGFQFGSEGMIGATPERLFALKGGRLETMALAGTAGAGDQEAFAADAKEIREHEFVAEYLMAKLEPLGTVRREPRRILDLGSIVHFHSNIQVDLENPRPDLNELIQLMHPTPALGAFPRGEGALRKLFDYRDRLGTPAYFGAPFGVYRNGRFHSVVAIRNIAWREREVFLPSGCGIIRESKFENEWRELRLKRSSVKALLGV